MTDAVARLARLPLWAQRSALAARQVVSREQEVVGDGKLREHAMPFDHMHEALARHLAWRGVGDVVVHGGNRRAPDRNGDRVRSILGACAMKRRN